MNSTKFKYICEFDFSEYDIDLDARILRLIEDNKVNDVVTPHTLLMQFGIHLVDSEKYKIVKRSNLEKYTRYIFFESSLIEGGATFFPHSKDKRSYGLKSGWCSAMTQGQALSLALRFYKLNLINKDFLDSILLSLDPRNNLNYYIISRDGFLWFEEYPSKPHSFVLNGNIFALFAIYEYLQNFNDLQYQNILERGISSLYKILPRFITYNNWTRYDLYKNNYAPMEYHKIHLEQLNFLSGNFPNFKITKQLRALHSPPRALNIRILSRQVLNKVILR